ncbi:unnamed protein product, partial [Nesidiocoris tenuis]
MCRVVAKPANSLVFGNAFFCFLSSNTCVHDPWIGTKKPCTSNHDVLPKRPNPLFREFHSRPSPNPRELQNCVVRLQTRPSPKCQIFQKR